MDTPRHAQVRTTDHSPRERPTPLPRFPTTPDQSGSFTSREHHRKRNCPQQVTADFSCRAQSCGRQPTVGRAVHLTSRLARRRAAWTFGLGSSRRQRRNLRICVRAMAMRGITRQARARIRSSSSAIAFWIAATSDSGSQNGVAWANRKPHQAAIRIVRLG